MSILLLLIPILAVFSSVVIYKHNGKKEFLKFDLVQFIYAFVVAPILFVWMKTFIFFLLKSDTDLNLSFNQIYLVETGFSVFFLYIFAFVVIHSLTASFNRKRLQDPLWDVFHHSEYFHLWLTHLVMYLGGMLLFTVLAITNLIFPLMFFTNRFGFYLILSAGAVTGILAFFSVWLSDPKQEANFMRIMKLAFSFFFLTHVVIYFIFDPNFSAQYSLYWLSLMIFSSLVVCSLVFHKSKKALKWYEKLKFVDWGTNNVKLFGKKK